MCLVVNLESVDHPSSGYISYWFSVVPIETNWLYYTGIVTMTRVQGQIFTCERNAQTKWTFLLYPFHNQFRTKDCSLD